MQQSSHGEISRLIKSENYDSLRRDTTSDEINGRVSTGYLATTKILPSF